MVFKWFLGLGEWACRVSVRNLIGMDWHSINHIIDCGLRRMVKLEALRTKNILVRVMRVHTHDYIKVFFFLILKVLVKEREVIGWVCLLYLFLLGLHFCGMCLLSGVAKECIFIAKLDLLVLRGLGRAFEVVFWSKIRIWRRIYWWTRKAKFGLMSWKVMLELRNNVLGKRDLQE